MENNDIDYILPVTKKEKKDPKKINKKLIIIITAVIVSVCLVVGSMLIFAPKLFSKESDKENKNTGTQNKNTGTQNKNESSVLLAGDWELTGNPEKPESTSEDGRDPGNAYYRFSKPNKYGEGTYKTYFDGGVEEGNYGLSERDGVEYIYMGTQALKFTVTESKLIITFPGYTDEMTGQVTPEQQYIFEKSKVPEYEKDSYDSYNIDEKLLNSFITTERTLEFYASDLSYTETLEFFDNGIMTIHYESEYLMLDRYMYYAYTAENNKLTFSLVTDRDTRYTVAYNFDEDGNLRFTDDNTKNSIFADAFFSTVTYYIEENLPKDTE